MVSLASLAVVVLLPSTSGTSTWVALAAVGVAVGLSAVGTHREALGLSAAALALAIGTSADLGAGSEVHRWASLAALPLVVPLAGLSLVRPSRAATAVLLTAALVAGPVRALAYDPLQDQGCPGCLPLPALIGYRPEARWWVLLGGVVALAALIARLPTGRQLPFLVALIGAGVWAATGWHEPRGVVVLACELGLLIALLAGTTSVIESLANRARLARLEALFHAGRGPEGALRTALGDPSAALAFAADGAWIGPDGATPRGPAAGQVSTPVWIGGRLAARIDHAPDAGRAQMVATTLTPELRVGIEQARLSALLHAQVRELRASRLRLVEAVDEERRRIERDLHDGAQQHVLALGFDIRRALAATPSDATLHQCMATTTLVLDELRTLSHGVYPAVLTGAGLGPALENLGPPVILEQIPAQRLPQPVEHTAYLVVSEMATAQRPLGVSVAAVDGVLLMTMTGGCLGPESLARERVKTLGGSVSVKGDRTEVRIPCA